MVAAFRSVKVDWQNLFALQLLETDVHNSKASVARSNWRENNSRAQHRQAVVSKEVQEESGTDTPLFKMAGHLKS